MTDTEPARVAADAMPQPHLPPDHGPVANPLPRLCSGADLTEDESEHLFERLVLGRLAEGEIGGLLIALRMKGETQAEMIGAARALNKAMVDFPRPDYRFADCCGTGGDNSGTINVSTATAFVAAACGLPIAKHGNRSVSSRCGSADVLEALGIRLDLPPAVARALLDETGFCFLFAPAYHPGMKHAAPIRRQLEVRTVMNLLGPCCNPARPPVQLLGVADPTKLERIVGTLQATGTEDALVVHGAGTDEIALHGPTRALRLSRGEVSELTITPEEVGIDRATLDALEGGDAGVNAKRMRDLLEGGGAQAERDAIALNTGALLMTAGLAADLKSGVDRARTALADGGGAKVLDAYAAASHG